MLKDILAKNRTLSKEMLALYHVDQEIQVPIGYIMKSSELKNLRIEDHVIDRYRSRFRFLSAFLIEQELRSELHKSFAISMGYKGRWKVSCFEKILLMDFESLKTVYHIDGNDRHLPSSYKDAYMRRIRNRGRRTELMFSKIAAK